MFKHNKEVINPKKDPKLKKHYSESSYNKHHQKKSIKKNHSKKKKWKNKITNSFLHTKYSSDYVGSERLTKYVGISAKCKISDSISRFEKIMPTSLRTRAKLDLKKILNHSNYEKVNNVPYNEEELPESNFSHDSESDSLPTPEPPNEEQEEISDIQPDIIDSSQSPSGKNVPNSEELSICSKIILESLHPALQIVNDKLFPEISNQEKLKKELLLIKSRYKSIRKNVSSSSNCESSQENMYNEGFSSSIEENFKLNPILTEEMANPNCLDTMFPSSQEITSSYSSTGSSVVELQRFADYKTLNYSSTSVSNVKNSGLSFIPCSPSSSSASSPIWKPQYSSSHFIPNSIPTPKLYYPQKMF